MFPSNLDSFAYSARFIQCLLLLYTEPTDVSSNCFISFCAHHALCFTFLLRLCSLTSTTNHNVMNYKYFPRKENIIALLYSPISTWISARPINLVNTHYQPIKRRVTICTNVGSRNCHISEYSAPRLLDEILVTCAEWLPRNSKASVYGWLIEVLISLHISSKSSIEVHVCVWKDECFHTFRQIELPFKRCITCQETILLRGALPHERDDVSILFFDSYGCVEEKCVEMAGLAKNCRTNESTRPRVNLAAIEKWMQHAKVNSCLLNSALFSRPSYRKASKPNRSSHYTIKQHRYHGQHQDTTKTPRHHHP
jgi:hypothetical protein